MVQSVEQTFAIIGKKGKRGFNYEIVALSDGLPPLRWANLENSFGIPVLFDPEFRSDWRTHVAGHYTIDTHPGILREACRDREKILTSNQSQSTSTMGSNSFTTYANGCPYATLTLTYGDIVFLVVDATVIAKDLKGKVYPIIRPSEGAEDQASTVVCAPGGRPEAAFRVATSIVDARTLGKKSRDKGQQNDESSHNDVDEVSALCARFKFRNRTTS